MSDAEDNAQFRTAFYWLGLAAMVVAIVMQFGWLGVLFCVGLILFAAGAS
ncbi:hypothetical protein LPW26_03185 [Rhodopseudomonas sp. HC1]|nr:hypothetical protein [Rhodopseudomonas infernalis]MCG6203631.1 hypothetical protein [Rhodopseudomonas infernalis]